MQKTQKLAVLEALGRAEAPISLPQLMAVLPSNYAERTVRRWLTEGVEDGSVVRTGKKRGTRYRLATHPPTEVADPASPIFRQESQKTLAWVRGPLFQRPPVAYNAEWFEDYVPNQTYYFPEPLLREMMRTGARSNDHEPAGTYARRIYNRLMIDLSYHSSRLEGNTYSLVDTERLLMEGASAEGKLNEEKVMILNHKEAIRYLVDSVPRLSMEDTEIYTLHYLLSDGLVPNHYSGKVRDQGVRVGSSTYIPIEGADRLSRQLHAIARKAAAIENPLEQSLFLLIHISYLQAFIDVNKRTARLSANIPLVKNNLVPLSFNAIDKNDYASSMLALYELNDINPLVDLYYASYSRTCDEYDATAESLGFDEIRVRYRSQRREIIRDVIVRKLTGPEMDALIHEMTDEMIPEASRPAFVEDVHEDLKEVSPQRIAGLGISRRDLDEWLKLFIQ